MKVRHVELHDIFFEDDQAVVYAGDSVLVLSPISAAVLELLVDDKGWHDSADLAESIEATFGPPPAQTILDGVEAVLEELENAGLIERNSPPSASETVIVTETSGSGPQLSVTTCELQPSQSGVNR